MRRLNNLKVAHLVGNIPSTVLEVALYFNADMHHFIVHSSIAIMASILGTT